MGLLLVRPGYTRQTDEHTATSLTGILFRRMRHE